MATTDEEGQSIRLMSIHQAKGLEFPIVVLPDLNRRQEQGRGSVVFHSELGPLVRLTKASAVHDPDITDTSDALGWKTYRTLEKVEEDAEASVSSTLPQPVRATSFSFPQVMVLTQNPNQSR